MGIEPTTSSLPRKCSTPELRQPNSLERIINKSQSGRRGSNPRPTAWKAVALPTELLPLIYTLHIVIIICNIVGTGRFELP